MKGRWRVNDGARFYLGTHEPTWLRVSGEWPLFVSRIRLARRNHDNLRACRPWALDSGGFTELNRSGRWTVSPADYAAEVRRWREQIGHLEWAAAQDWMCEPFVLSKTGLTVREHQERTVANYLELLRIAPDLPWVPVLQGWEFEDYLRCRQMYASAGVDLASLPLVGLGSVCRRQNTGMVEELVRHLYAGGIQLHGFGFKLQGLARCADVLASADSMAWSYAARKRAPLPGCPHKSCANCYRYAALWRERVVSAIGRDRGAEQLTFWRGG